MNKKRGTILIIDDDEGVLHTAKIILKPHFTKIKTLDSPRLVENILKQEQVDVVILDMNFSAGITNGKEGLSILKKIKEIDPNTEVLINTAYGDINLAVEAMKAGAMDFLTKPWEKEKLLSTVHSVFALSKTKKEVNQLKHKTKLLNQDLHQPYQQIISKSNVMAEIFKVIDKIAGTDTNVLVLGDNGTGKELIARAIHQHSQRAGESFIKVDLGAITESLFASELFGHKKGSFTDAKEDRPGRFEVANGGTLFLDEIGNITPPIQAKLLSALQQREVFRIGSNKAIPLDIRLVCATNKDIYGMVSKNLFRQDLLYRINTVEITLPPLRERKEDIPIIATHYLNIFSKKYQKGNLVISENTMRNLINYEWPGNIRELQHAVERAVIMGTGDKITNADFLLKKSNIITNRPLINTLNIEKLEEYAIKTAITQAQGNLSKASESLGIGRTTLYRKMKRYNISDK